MTTDDGLKGLTDAQLVALYSELRHTSKEFCGLPHPMKNWTEEHDAAIANAARAWLAANVHDSGDGVRAGCEKLIHSWRNPPESLKLTHHRSYTVDAFSQAADELEAILAEKGEV